MKKIYLSILFATSVLLAQAQTLQVSLDQYSVCEGETVSASVTGPEFNLVSPAMGTNNQNGVMFNLTAINAVTLKGFLINPLQGNTSMEIYYRTGSFVGFEDASTGWNLLGVSSGVAMGTAVNTGIDLSLPIAAGQTMAFYVTCTGVGEFIDYGDGTAVGNVLQSDGFLTIYEGVGKSYPFLTTYTPRLMVGSVLYEPVISNISWNVSSSTAATTDFVADRGIAVQAKAFYGGIERTGYAVLDVTDVEVEATATPDLIQPGQSSTLSAEVTVSKGIYTTFSSGNGSDGAMMDVSADNALSVTGFTVGFLDAGQTTVEVLYKTGSYVGSQANPNAWTSLGTYSVTAGLSTYIQLNTPLAMLAGQTMSFYVTTTDGATNVAYTNAGVEGTVYTNDANLTIKVGIGVEYPFSFNYSPRMLNTIIHYDVVDPIGITYAWMPGGGSSGSQLVSPPGSTEYNLDVTADGCEGTTTVVVAVNNVGIEEAIANNLSIFPNPATDIITISMIDPMDVEHISLMDVNGRTVYSASYSHSLTRAEVPVSDLAKGMYLLQVQVGNALVNYRVAVQ